MVTALNLVLIRQWKKGEDYLSVVCLAFLYHCLSVYMRVHFSPCLRNGLLSDLMRLRRACEVDAKLVVNVTEPGADAHCAADVPVSLLLQHQWKWFRFTFRTSERHTIGRVFLITSSHDNDSDNDNRLQQLALGQWGNENEMPCKVNVASE